MYSQDPLPDASLEEHRTENGKVLFYLSLFNLTKTVGLLESTMKTSFTNGKRLASTWALNRLPIGGKFATN